MEAPESRLQYIAENIEFLAFEQLVSLFEEIRAEIPSAKLTKQKIIINRNNNNTVLEVTIPVTGINANALCLSCVDKKQVVHMNWTLKKKLPDGRVMCCIDPMEIPVSVARIVQWFNSN